RRSRSTRCFAPWPASPAGDRHGRLASDERSGHDPRIMREIVIDTETTGLDAARDRSVEGGCVELLNHIPTGRRLQLYVNPGIRMSAEAAAVHGLTDAFLADKPRFEQVADELVAFLGDAPLIAHNAEFDFRFLNAEFARLNLKAI